MTIELLQGPINNPNDVEDCKVLREADIKNFYVVETTKGETLLVHKSQLRLKDEVKHLVKKLLKTYAHITD